jgi:multicomponent K+:H+ antiporter subunit G
MSAGAVLAEVIVSLAIVLGAGFALVGSWGLVRLPTLMERQHGPTMASTLGLAAMLVGSALYVPLIRGAWSTHEVLITLFVFITAPVTANLIAKVHLHRVRQGDTSEPIGPAGEAPSPEGAADWATHEAPHEGTPGDLAGD